MVTPIMLNCKGKLPELAGLERSPHYFAASVLLGLVLSLSMKPANAELVLGASLEDRFEETTEDAVEEQAEDLVEEQIQDQVQEQVQEQVQDQVEERVLVLGSELIEETIEDQVEDGVQDVIEDEVEQQITENIEITLEGNIENEIEQEVEETIESIVEESVEGTVEQRIEDSVAETINESVEETLELAVEDELASNIEQEIESGIETAVESSIEDTVETNIEMSVEQSVEATAEAQVETAMELQVASYVEGRLEDGIDEILERRIEIDEDRIHKDQWLVMAAPEAFDELAKEGYLFETVSELPGLGLRLAEVAAPSSFDITTIRQGVIDVVGSDRAEVDLNHIYTAGERLAENAEEGVAPRSAIEFPEDTDQLALRIGMIDSQVDVSHPSLKHASIETKAFTPRGAQTPEFHGTAIASIIAGSGSDYVGIAPNAQLFAAGVFEQDPQRGEIASTVSLVRALDWLVSSGVDVVNISLAGPPNRLLESALERASNKDVTILAAAGNGGPVADPMYPAAYRSVVAVTAVDTEGQVFRLANRGDYLDIAAPGVAMRHAKSGGGYTASSGTSFAVPFAATAVARLRQLQPGEDVLEMLWSTAEDLGPPGRDSIYGFGLLRPASS
ncbi:MAG: S8 family serine peptidase [Pseudomonadota bacterium]